MEIREEWEIVFINGDWLGNWSKIFKRSLVNLSEILLRNLFFLCLG